MPRPSEGVVAIGFLIAFSFWIFVALPVWFFPCAAAADTQQAAPPGSDSSLALWTSALFVATVVLALATIGLGVLAYRQLVASDRAHQIANRAYLSVEPGGLNPPYGPVAHHTVIGHITIRNVGHVIARNVRWSKEIVQSPDGQREAFPDGTVEGRNTLLPTVEMTLGTVALTLAPTGFIYVWGKVEYDDGFGRQRFTKFCHRYNRQTLQQMQGRTSYWVPADLGRFHEHGNDAD